MRRWRLGGLVGGLAPEPRASQRLPAAPILPQRPPAPPLPAGLPRRRLAQALLTLGLLTLGLLTVLAACAPPPPPPTVVNLTLVATSDVNGTPGGQGAPLVVRIYQLSSDAAFSGAEFFQLFNQDAATLKSDLVKKDEYILAPGQTKTATLNPNSTVTEIGIFAAYRSFQTVTWRAVVDVAPNKTTNINVQATAKGIVVKTDPAAALKPAS
jgi:type VI secretion system protein VasD